MRLSQLQHSRRTISTVFGPLQMSSCILSPCGTRVNRSIADLKQGCPSQKRGPWAQCPCFANHVGAVAELQVFFDCNHADYT